MLLLAEAFAVVALGLEQLLEVRFAVHLQFVKSTLAASQMVIFNENNSVVRYSLNRYNTVTTQGADLASHTGEFAQRQNRAAFEALQARLQHIVRVHVETDSTACCGERPCEKRPDRLQTNAPDAAVTKGCRARQCNTAQRVLPWGIQLFGKRHIFLWQL